MHTLQKLMQFTVSVIPEFSYCQFRRVHHFQSVTLFIMPGRSNNHNTCLELMMNLRKERKISFKTWELLEAKADQKKVIKKKKTSLNTLAHYCAGYVFSEHLVYI